MNRREFFKTSTMAATAIAATPIILTGGREPHADGLYILDPNGHEVFIPGKTPMSVLEFHRAIQNELDKFYNYSDMLDITNPNPTIRHTDELIEMVNGYKIPERSFKLIHSGTIKQDGEYLTSRVLLIRDPKNPPYSLPNKNKRVYNLDEFKNITNGKS